MSHIIQHHEMKVYGEIKLFTGTASPALAHKISDYLGSPLCEHEIIEFPNENLFIKLKHSVRGQDVYLIQHTASPVHRNIMELLITIQTLRLNSAARITVVLPYLAYGRSDKKDQPRVPITSRLIADMIEGCGRGPLHDARPARRTDPRLLFHPRRCVDLLAFDHWPHQPNHPCEPS